MAFPIPETIVRTSHSLTIKANGFTIGLINGWNPSIGRTITPIYQIATRGSFETGGGFVPSGDPVEKVPGNVTGQTIAVQRYDLYKTRVESAFGLQFVGNPDQDLMMLSNQLRGFTVEEVWEYPDDQGGGTERLEYAGCWFSNIGRNYRSDGDRIINTNATLEYTRRRKTANA